MTTLSPGACSPVNLLINDCAGLPLDISLFSAVCNSPYIEANLSLVPNFSNLL